MTIEERFDRLERQNRKLKKWVAGIAALALVAIVAGTVGVVKAGTTNFDIINAKMIYAETIYVRKSGRYTIKLYVPTTGRTHMAFYDPQGRRKSIYGSEGYYKFP